MRTLAEIVPLRTPDCLGAEDAVVLIAAREAGAERTAEEHVMSCLRCQAEVAAYRRVLAIMRTMREDELPGPAGGLEGALEALRTAEWAPVWAVRAAYVGGITAASAAGVLVWFSRRRLGLPHAS